MTEITYKIAQPTKTFSYREEVYLDGRRIGEIRGDGRVYQYKPKGGPGGDLFDTDLDVKASIEG